MIPALFYVFSILAVLSALSVILAARPTRALLSLLVTMFSLAVLFVLQGAYFIAMVHLIVYAGAVLVLFLFVIMLQGIGATDTPLGTRFKRSFTLVAATAGTAFLIFLTIIIKSVWLPPHKEVNGTIEAVGTILFSDYVLPFELTSLLILIGVLAAVTLAKKETSPS